MKALKEYANSIFSQTGEDGILDEIFGRLNIDQGFCVEFGASDGINISNAYHFIKNKGWGALLIESDPERFKSLEENMKEFPNVESLQSLVSHKGDNSLDSIFKTIKVPASGIDLLSIDVDGSDYCIWEALSSHSPKCVVIEYAASFPPWVEYTEKPNQELGFGSSALSLIKLGESKGYKLVALTVCNLLFVHGDFFKELNIEEVNLSDAFEYETLTFVISKSNGELFLSRERPLHFKFMKDRDYSYSYEEAQVYPYGFKAAPGSTMGAILNAITFVPAEPPTSPSPFWPVHLIRR